MSAASAPFPWHDPDALNQLFAPHGFSLNLTEHRFAFTAASPRDYLDRDSASHPVAIAGRRILEQHGTADATYRQLLAILDAANEDPTGFRVTSRYITAAACRGDGCR